MVSKNQKVATTKALFDLNYSATQIAQLLDIHRATAYRYKEVPASEDVRRFATEIKSYFISKQSELMARILTKIEKKLDETDDLRMLLRGYEVISKQTPLFEIGVKFPPESGIMDMMSDEELEEELSKLDEWRSEQKV